MSNNTIHDYFPSDEASNISKEFTVDKSTLLIQIKGLPDDSCLYVEYYFGDDCDGCWQPFNLECCQMKLCNCQNSFFFPFPGKFRLVAISEDDNHLSDPSYFEDLEIQITKMEGPKNLENYYVRCESYTDRVLKTLLESDLLCDLLESRLTN